MHDGHFISGWICVAILIGLIGIGFLIAWLVKKNSTHKTAASHTDKQN